MSEKRSGEEANGKVASFVEDVERTLYRGGASAAGVP